MTRGRHAAPDLVHISLTASLFIDLLVFLAIFFEYFPTGRRVVLLESWTRPLALAALLAGGMAWTVRPAASLGWATGPRGPLLLGIEFIVAPLVAVLMVHAIGIPGRPRGVRD